MGLMLTVSLTSLPFLLRVAVACWLYFELVCLFSRVLRSLRINSKYSSKLAGMQESTFKPFVAVMKEGKWPQA